jgi:hydrogenase assembly chaperone HypC/HupF
VTCGSEHCITCSDEGVPMRVVAALEDGLARCAAEGVESDVMVDLVAPVAVGDEVLVHAGVALARVA